MRQLLRNQSVWIRFAMSFVRNGTAWRADKFIAIGDRGFIPDFDVFSSHIQIGIKGGFLNNTWLFSHVVIPASARVFCGRNAGISVINAKLLRRFRYFSLENPVRRPEWQSGWIVTNLKKIETTKSTKHAKILHKEGSDKITGAYLNVYKDKGSGFFEAIYQECVRIESEYERIVLWFFFTKWKHSGF